MSLSKQQMLAADDLPRVCVPVPEWDGEVYLRTMTVGEAEKWAATVRESGEVPTNAIATFLVTVLTDENGERLFEDSDAEALAGKSALVLKRIFEIALEQNGLADSDELAKN